MSNTVSSNIVFLVEESIAIRKEQVYFMFLFLNEAGRRTKNEYYIIIDIFLVNIIIITNKLI